MSQRLSWTEYGHGKATLTKKSSVEKCGYHTWVAEHETTHAKLLIKWYCRDIEHCPKCRQYWIDKKMERFQGMEATHRVVVNYSGKEQTASALEMIKRRSHGEYLWMLKLDKETGSMVLILYVRDIAPSYLAEYFGKVLSLDVMTSSGQLLRCIEQDMNSLSRWAKRRRIIQASHGFFLPIVADPKGELHGFKLQLVSAPIGQVVTAFKRKGIFNVNRVNGNVWLATPHEDAYMTEVRLSESDAAALSRVLQASPA